MIRARNGKTKLHHAIGIQIRRVQKGKIGYARCVRRWIGTLNMVERMHADRHLPVSDHDLAEIMSDNMEDNSAAEYNSAAYKYAFGTE